VGVRRAGRPRRRGVRVGDELTPGGRHMRMSGKASFRSKTSPPTATREPRRSGRFRPTATVSST
jgi:hypothetical protein